MNKLNYVEMKNVFSNNERMLENINRLEKFENFHLLIEGSDSVSSDVCNKYKINSEEYKDWLTVCDGGYLFDTLLLPSKEYSINDVEFLDTISVINENSEENGYNIPSEYLIIGIKSYGDLICVSSKDNKVYLWSLEEQDFNVIWDSFTDFMIDEIDTAIELIKEDSLEPFPCKCE